jgi:RNA polymerase sigma-70 factor (ECF subfamily)
MDEDQLVQRGRRGDPQAIILLVNSFQRDVFRLALAVLENPSKAEQATLDSFAAAIQHFGPFKGEVSFKTWLFAITVSCCLQRWRRERLGRSLFQRVPGRSRFHERSERQGELGESQPEFRTAASTLQMELRLPLILRYYHELPVTEIAAVLGINERKVHNRLRAALLALAGRRDAETG